MRLFFHAADQKKRQNFFRRTLFFSEAMESAKEWRRTFFAFSINQRDTTSVTERLPSFFLSAKRTLG